MLCEIPLGQCEGAVSQCSYKMERNEDRCERDRNRDSQRIDSHHGNEGLPLAPVLPSAPFLTQAFRGRPIAKTRFSEDSGPTKLTLMSIDGIDVVSPRTRFPKQISRHLHVHLTTARFNRGPTVRSG